MLRLFLERMLPAKPTDDPVALQIPLTNDHKASGISMRGEAILQAVSIGEISPEQGKAIMGIIDAQRKNIETPELLFNHPVRLHNVTKNVIFCIYKG